MSKTEFEKKVIIKARRLRKKKTFYNQCMNEIYDEMVKNPKLDLNQAMKNYIKKAGKISVKEKKNKNAV